MARAVRTRSSRFSKFYIKLNDHQRNYIVKYSTRKLQPLRVQSSIFQHIFTSSWQNRRRLENAFFSWTSSSFMRCVCELLHKAVRNLIVIRVGSSWAEWRVQLSKNFKSRGLLQDKRHSGLEIGIHYQMRTCNVSPEYWQLNNYAIRLDFIKRLHL